MTSDKEELTDFFLKLHVEWSSVCEILRTLHIHRVAQKECNDFDR